MASVRKLHFSIKEMSTYKLEIHGIPELRSTIEIRWVVPAGVSGQAMIFPVVIGSQFLKRPIFSGNNIFNAAIIGLPQLQVPIQFKFKIPASLGGKPFPVDVQIPASSVGTALKIGNATSLSEIEGEGKVQMALIRSVQSPTIQRTMMNPLPATTQSVPLNGGSLSLPPMGSAFF